MILCFQHEIYHSRFEISNTVAGTHNFIGIFPKYIT